MDGPDSRYSSAASSAPAGRSRTVSLKAGATARDGPPSMSPHMPSTGHDVGGPTWAAGGFDGDSLDVPDRLVEEAGEHADPGIVVDADRQHLGAVRGHLRVHASGVRRKADRKSVV